MYLWTEDRAKPAGSPCFQSKQSEQAAGSSCIINIQMWVLSIFSSSFQQDTKYLSKRPAMAFKCTQLVFNTHKAMKHHPLHHIMMFDSLKSCVQLFLFTHINIYLFIYPYFTKGNLHNQQNMIWAKLAGNYQYKFTMPLLKTILFGTSCPSLITLFPFHLTNVRHFPPNMNNGEPQLRVKQW